LVVCWTSIIIYQWKRLISPYQREIVFINKEKTSYGCRYKYASHGHHLLKDQLPVKSKPISLPYLRL
ncbi:hypothetical protein M1N67_03510, partial [Peptococcaceae bacterium]|nr:hypothetical protein [Peptococcaceae bacterium]